MTNATPYLQIISRPPFVHFPLQLKKYLALKSRPEQWHILAIFFLATDMKTIIQILEKKKAVCNSSLWSSLHKPWIRFLMSDARLACDLILIFLFPKESGESSGSRSILRSTTGHDREISHLGLWQQTPALLRSPWTRLDCTVSSCSVFGPDLWRRDCEGNTMNLKKNCKHISYFKGRMKQSCNIKTSTSDSVS